MKLRMDKRSAVLSWCRAAVAMAAIFSQSAVHATGQLVIAGGAVRADNAEVFGEFVTHLSGDGPVVVIPAASGRPARSGQSAAESLAMFGEDAARLEVFPLALLDDRGTEDVDESSWKENAWGSALVRRIETAAGFWFTGGDQSRITQLTRSASGEESPFLQLLRKRLQDGAVIGGTSAGAAIMSTLMITGGDSFTALTQPEPGEYNAMTEQEQGHLSLSAGLGFLPRGLVDQHFDRKARLGRLIRALPLTGEQVGLGVDEDTALSVDLGTGEARVVGSGSVVRLDTSDASFAWDGETLASGIRLSVYPRLTRFRLSDGVLLETQGEPTMGNEYYDHSVRLGGGMAFPNQTLEQMLGNDLLDNAGTSRLVRVSVDSAGTAISYRFIQRGSSKGFWDRAQGANRYTIIGVGMDVTRTTANRP